MDEDFGNAGSRTHTYGQAAKERVTKARGEVAAVVGADPDEVIFTSGATESNNLALLGLRRHGLETGRQHIVSTMIEHKAVLEPLAALQEEGFEVTLVPPTIGGWVDPEAILAAVRSDTLIVSVMAVNNETGVIQPLEAIAAELADHPAYLHVDAAQAFGKNLSLLREPRIDLVSISGHKLYAPKGVGALVARRRRYERPPIHPLSVGGGQERGLRPGTLPVPLIAGLGTAATLAVRHHVERERYCLAYRAELVEALAPLTPIQNGDPARTVPHTINVSIPGVDAEAAILALKDIVAISNGAACTSQRYEPSHVLAAMGLRSDRATSALRLSWSYLTPQADWDAVADRLERVRS
jgi:cysteine desulfurase